MRSILYNLVSNSIKYSAAEKTPQIVITTNHVDEYMVISVKDNGMGTPKKDLEKIFTKYERLANAVEGTGVGLFLVREIVNLSGGKITVESEVGVGSTFTVCLKA